MSGRSRANGEGSIFPYRNGYAAYVWVTTPAGQAPKEVRLRQDTRGSTREVAQASRGSRRGPVAPKVPTVGATSLLA